MAQAKGQPYPGSDSGPPYGPTDNRSGFDKFVSALPKNIVKGVTEAPNVYSPPNKLGSLASEAMIRQLSSQLGGKKKGGTVKKRGGKVHGAPSRPRLDRAPRKGGGGC